MAAGHAIVQRGRASSDRSATVLRTRCDGGARPPPRRPSFLRPVACGGRTLFSFRSMLRVVLTSVVLLAAGCATTSTPSAVLLEGPEEHCEKIGALAVRTSTELLAPEDA